MVHYIGEVGYFDSLGTDDFAGLERSFHRFALLSLNYFYNFISAALAYFNGKNTI